MERAVDDAVPSQCAQRGLLQCLESDLYRYNGETGLGGFLRAYWLHPGFHFTVWFRTAAWLSGKRTLRPLHWLAEWRRRGLEIKYGICIFSDTKIGPGLYIGHWGGIAVSSDAVIGANCNLSLGVVIGKDVRGPRSGTPVLGDYVYVGPGAKVFGGIRVGSEVAIGANCVVNRSVEDGSVVVGVPGRVVSQKGSREYVRWVLADARGPQPDQGGLTADQETPGEERRGHRV